MPAVPLCAKAREEATASTQTTTVNAIIGREVVMPKVLRRRGQLMEQAGGEWRKGRRPRSRTNTWRASGMLMLLRRGRSNRAPNFAQRGAWHPLRRARSLVDRRPDVPISSPFDRLLLPQGTQWTEYSADSQFDADLGYLHLAEFARHLISLWQAGRVAELTEAFGAIERLHVRGDDYVRE